VDPKLSRHGAPDENLPLRLRAVFLDAITGKVTGTHDWPTDSRYASIVAARDGGFVTQRGTHLSSYSKDLVELGTLDLPPTKEIGWSPHSSLSGKNIVFIDTNLLTRAGVRWIWVETDNLKVVRSWEEPQSGWVDISDKWIAMTACVWFYDCKPFVEIRSLGTDWKSIVRPLPPQKPHPAFVTDDLLFLFGQPIKLIRTDGEVESVEDLSFEGCWWSLVVRSAGQGRAIMPSCKLEGKIAALDIGGTDVLKKFLVFDAPFHALSYTLDIKGPTIRDITQLAISPDGLTLALLNDGFVEIFRLPPLQ